MQWLDPTPHQLDQVTSSISQHYPDSVLHLLTYRQDAAFLAWCAQQHLPNALQYSARKRQQQFLAGRYCAAMALQQLYLSHNICHQSGLLARQENGQVSWPLGYTGSISHHDGIALAWIAPCTAYDQLGLDLEGIVHPERAQKLQARVLHPSERQLGHALGYSAELWFTLLFSCKESIYKLLSSHAGRVMPFQSVEIIRVKTVRLDSQHLISDHQPAYSRLDLICRLTEAWAAEWPRDTQLSVSAVLLAEAAHPQWVLSYTALSAV